MNDKKGVDTGDKTKVTKNKENTDLNMDITE